MAVILILELVSIHTLKLNLHRITHDQSEVIGDRLERSLLRVDGMLSVVV